MRTPANALNLEGQRFGKLTVIKRSNKRRFGGRSLWECRCDCGTESLVQTGNLRTGNSTTCGRCRKRTLRGVIGRVISMRRHTAGKRGLPWTIDFQLAEKLMMQPCFYCGDPPLHYMSHPFDRKFKYQGIDRIDSQLGYEPGNVRPCCRHCNIAKASMTELEFKGWCQKMIKHEWWNK